MFLGERKQGNWFQFHLPTAKSEMSQGLVNGIKNNAQFLGFKNDRGVIPLFQIFHANL